MDKLKINFCCRTYLRKGTNSIQIRVRWNNKKNEVDTALGLYAEPGKWDSDVQGPKKNTTHKVGVHPAISARDINRAINSFIDAVEEVFFGFERDGVVPSNEDFRTTLSEKLGRELSKQSKQDAEEKNRVSLDDAFHDFIKIRPTEVLWGEETHQKYDQMMKHLKKCDKDITLDHIDKVFLNKLKISMIEGGYHNATIAKQFRNIRGFLNWSKLNGYDVNDDALIYKANIPVQAKRVVFLKFQELMDFYQFRFPDSLKYLDRARDLFCFMAFTSLRYSDLKALKKSDIKEDCLEIYTEKTDDMLRIPLTSYAKQLLEKYANNPGINVFSVPSNQKLNDYIKEAAKVAGLDREVTEVYYSGKVKHEAVNKLYETLSCHDGRRTFVCCSLAFGISATTVMSCTGHADYKAMQPYIDVADETARKEIKKWDKQSNRSKLLELIDQLDDGQMLRALTRLQQAWEEGIIIFCPFIASLIAFIIFMIMRWFSTPHLYKEGIVNSLVQCSDTIPEY